MLFGFAAADANAAEATVAANGEYEVVGTCSAVDETTRLVSEKHPDVLLIDLHDFTEIEDIGKLVRKVHRVDPSLYVAVMIARGMTYNMKSLFGEGANDFLYKPFNENSLAEIDKGLVRASAPTGSGSALPGRNGKAVSFISPKGGVGKTFLAVNTAVGLAHLSDKKVLLVDCSFPFSDIPMLLDISYQNKNLFDLLSFWDKSSQGSLPDYVCDVERLGISVLLAPQGLREASDIMQNHRDALGDVLTQAKRSYDYVIIDTSPRYYDFLLPILQVSDLVMGVVTSEAQTMLLLKDFREQLMREGVSFDFRAVMNKRQSKAMAVIGAEVAGMLPQGVFASIDDDYAWVAVANNKGIPAIADEAKSKVKPQLVAFVKAVEQLLING